LLNDFQLISRGLLTTNWIRFLWVVKFLLSEQDLIVCWSGIGERMLNCSKGLICMIWKSNQIRIQCRSISNVNEWHWIRVILEVFVLWLIFVPNMTLLWLIKIEMKEGRKYFWRSFEILVMSQLETEIITRIFIPLHWERETKRRMIVKYEASIYKWKVKILKRF
jgi:hypothetical protein